MGKVRDNLELLPIDVRLDDDLVKNYIDIEAIQISMNEFIDIDFIRKWREKLDWRTLSINFQFSEAELMEFFGSIHWKSAVYCQEVCTKEFIQDNGLEWVIEYFQKFNIDFMSKSISNFGNIDNLLIINEANRDVIIDILALRIFSKIGYNSDGELEVCFENGDIYLVSDKKAVQMVRELKIESLMTSDIIEATRITVSKFGIKI